MTPSPHDLTDPWKAVLVLAFGASTSLLIGYFAELGARPFDLLLLAGSLGAIVTAGLWLWILAARRSLAWGLAFTALVWVPYLNFVIASVYARRFWSEGARAPALLALGAMLVETVATLRIFLLDLSPPV